MNSVHIRVHPKFAQELERWKIEIDKKLYQKTKELFPYLEPRQTKGTELTYSLAEMMGKNYIKINGVGISKEGKERKMKKKYIFEVDFPF